MKFPDEALEILKREVDKCLSDYRKDPVTFSPLRFNFIFYALNDVLLALESDNPFDVWRGVSV